MRFISLQTFKEQALVSLTGKSEAFIQQIGKQFLEERFGDILRHKALKRIRWHRKSGHFTFIITSCPDIYLPFLVNYLKFDGYEGSRLAYRNGKFLGTFADRDCTGFEKVRRLQKIVELKKIDLSHSYAYSDHESDLPMLELVGKPAVVTPTEKLRRIALDRNWKIEEW